MEICSVTLKNFKTHRDCFYEFRPGTNAICGENGAGKTSILEAIAWVLFDHSDYTRGELIRTGAKSAQATVCFLSHLDERAYEVRRCTSRGYELHDPQLHLNLGLRKLEDVQAWMREHIGVPPQTDLARLFAETIGIPQGTFTTDFLKRPVERKKIFDPILKVEEYKQTYDQMRDLETYAKAQVATLSQQLAHTEQQLADWEDLQHQSAALNTAIAEDEAQIAQLTQQIAQLQTEADQLTHTAQQVQTLETQVRQQETQLAIKTEAFQQLETAWQSAQQAVNLCRTKRESYQTYETAKETLQQLSDQRRQQQMVLKQRDDLRQSLGDREVKVLQLQGQLATFTELRQDLERWQVLVPQQQQLQLQQQQLQQALQRLETLKPQQQALEARSQICQTQGKQLKAEITMLEATQPQVDQIPQLELERQHLQARMSRLQAGQEFAGELQSIATTAKKNGDRYREQVLIATQQLTTLISNDPNLVFVQQVLDAGVTLNTDVGRSLQTLLHTLSDPTEMAAAEAKFLHLGETLQAAQTLQQQLAVLPFKHQKITELRQELSDLNAQLADCARQLTQEPDFQLQLTQIEIKLQELNDPQGHLRLIQQQLQQAEQVQSQLAQLQAGLQPLQQNLIQLETQLANFAELDTQFEATQQLLHQHDDDHQQYLRHRNEANTFKPLDLQRTTAQTELTTLQSAWQQIQEQWQQAQQAYNPQQLLQINASLIQLKQQQDQRQGSLQPKQAQLQNLTERLQAKQSLAEQQTRDRQVLIQKEQTLQFIGDARHIFNQSGPRITQYYLSEVSAEADKLFRELLNRDEVTLQWTEDYDIRVKERGYERSFRSLSGGEQMCAALAVRLALLRVLADINIAFFDEPTTNMDQLRRTQLAEAINNLKAFRQLIVISHDDTFENVTEHVIRLERQPL